MKAKLVKYPFDNKKYQWNQYKMGKEFEYTWFKSVLKDWKSVRPYYTYGEIKNLKAAPEVYGTVDWDNLGKSYDENITNDYQGLVKDANGHTSCLIQKQIPDTVPRKVVTTYSDVDMWFSQPGTYTYNGETFEVTSTPKLYYKITAEKKHSYPHGIALTKNGPSITADEATSFYSPSIGSTLKPNLPSQTDYCKSNGEYIKYTPPTSTFPDLLDGSTITCDEKGGTPGVTIYSSNIRFSHFVSKYLYGWNTDWKTSRNPIDNSIIHWKSMKEIQDETPDTSGNNSDWDEIAAEWPGVEVGPMPQHLNLYHFRSQNGTVIYNTMSDFVYQVVGRHRFPSQNYQLKNMPRDWHWAISS